MPGFEGRGGGSGSLTPPESSVPTNTATGALDVMTEPVRSPGMPSISRFSTSNGPRVAFTTPPFGVAGMPPPARIACDTVMLTLVFACVPRTVT